jgi:hypothetical protein
MSEHDFQREVLDTLSTLKTELSNLVSALAERCPARIKEIAELRADLNKLEDDTNAAFKKIGELKTEIASIQATMKTVKWAAGVIGSVIGCAASIGVTLLLRAIGG